MRLYLVRHTAPAIAKGICYGQSDVPLAETFSAEYETIASELPSDLSVIYTSPLQRCYRLAKALANQRGVPLVVDNRLQELNFGAWELQLWDAIPQAELDAWMYHYTTARVPGGESYADLQERMVAFVNELPHSGYPAACIITHSGWLKVARAHLLGQPPAEAMAASIPFGSIWVHDLAMPLQAPQG
jgi:alpha-ribazole phosphatase